MDETSELSTSELDGGADDTRVVQSEPDLQTASTPSSPLRRQPPDLLALTPGSLRTEAPRIRLHSPANRDEATDPAASLRTVNKPGTTAVTLVDAIAVGDPPETSAWSESLHNVHERTESTPPRSPSRGSSETRGLADGPDGSSTDNRSKGNRASVVGISSPASATALSTPRPPARTVRTAELRALEGLADPDLEAKAWELAQQLWEGDESFVETRKAAEWLGSASRLSTATLRQYMSKFEFTGLRLDGAFR